MDRIREHGEVCPGFISEPERCLRMVYDNHLQAGHWPRTALMDRAMVLTPRRRSFRVWVCPNHLDGLTGVQQWGAWAPHGVNVGQGSLKRRRARGLAGPVEEPPRAQRPPTDRLPRLAALRMSPEREV